MQRVRQFFLVGGMPAFVAAFVQSSDDPRESEAVMQNLLATYRDDFAKYAKVVQRRRLEPVFIKVPRLVGGKFKYS